jgi:hypothetical protein
LRQRVLIEEVALDKLDVVDEVSDAFESDGARPARHPHDSVAFRQQEFR